MEVLKIYPPSDFPAEVSIDLESSKSISNRLLIIRALGKLDFDIQNISKAQDSTQLHELIQNPLPKEIYAGAGGTTYRFLLGYLALQNGPYLLTANKAMSKRPIAPLVEALRKLGAQITYKGEQGVPPVLVKGGALKGGTIHIPASLSSQFISALLLIAPYVKGGLKIIMEGPVNSRPYLEMTCALMKKFGAEVSLQASQIQVREGNYNYSHNSYTVESDWSGASYFWAHASSLPIRKMTLKGLFKDSLQGDAILTSWAKQQGFDTQFKQEGLQLIKQRPIKTNWTSYLDLNDYPDLAQTVIALFAIEQKSIQIKGLQTLFHKETDRLRAMQIELAKAACYMEYSEQGTLTLNKFSEQKRGIIRFDPHQDHRMAMALSLFAQKRPIEIVHTNVVKKSFPKFWDELEKLGFTLHSLPHPEKVL